MRERPRPTANGPQCADVIRNNLHPVLSSRIPSPPLLCNLARCFSGRLDVARSLIECGAEVRATCESSRGWEPLHYAADAGHAPVVALLLASGADVDAEDTQGHTALHLAPDKATAILLIQRGADPNRRVRRGLYEGADLCPVFFFVTRPCFC